MAPIQWWNGIVVFSDIGHLDVLRVWSGVTRSNCVHDRSANSDLGWTEQSSRYANHYAITQS